MLSLVLGCGSGDGSSDPESPAGLYVELGCERCHGESLQGTRTAPALEDLGRRWEEDELVAYFKSPESFFQSKPQLQYLSERYAVDMPPIVGATDEELHRVARWLLERSHS